MHPRQLHVPWLRLEGQVPLSPVVLLDRYIKVEEHAVGEPSPREPRSQTSKKQVRTNFLNQVKVRVRVQDTRLMPQRRLGDDEVTDGAPVPHAAMERKVGLQPKDASADVGWGLEQDEGVAEFGLLAAVVAR